MADKTVDRRINIWINDEKIKNSFRSLNKELSKQQNVLRGMTRGSKDYNKQLKKVNNLRGALQKHRNDLKGVNRGWQNIKTTMLGFLAAGGIAGLVTSIIRGFQKLISVNSELSDSFADVMKTTGLTREAVQKLDKDLQKLDTRTPRKKLLELARDAGKLGIQGRKNILGFVEAADKIEVALGEDLGQGAIKNIGKLNEVFKITKELGIAKGMEATGSAINALGQASTANEEFIVSFTQRMAGMAEQAGISIEDTLGLASAVDQLGLTSELSSTAIGKTIIAMFKDTASFAKIAGKSTEEFTKLLNEDTNEALLVMLEGLNGNNEGLGVLAGKLDDVGLDGARAVQTLASLAGNIEIVTEAQVLSNDEFAKATSLQDEFNVKNNNLAGNLAKIGKQLTNIWGNSAFINNLTRVTGLITDFLKQPVAEKLEGERIEMNRLANAALNAATSEEDRLKLINQLVANYPEYLGHLNKDKVTNEELAIAIGNANLVMLDKIELTIREARVQEAANKAAVARVKSIDAEANLSRDLIKLNDELELGVDLTTGTLEDQFRKIKDAAKDKGITGSDSWLAKTALNLGFVNGAMVINSITATNNEKVINDLNGSYAAFAVSTERSRIESELLDAVLNNNIDSITTLKASLSEITGTTEKDPTKPGGSTGELSDEEKEKIRKREIEKKKIEDQIRFELLSGDDQELAREQKKWDELVALAEKYGLDVTGLSEARAKALEEIELKHAKREQKIKDDANKRDAAEQKRINNQELADAQALQDAKLRLLMSSSLMLGSVINFMGQQGAEMSSFQKALAVAQIAIDTAVAWISATKISVESSEVAGPFAPILAAANFATFAGIILSGASQAKNILAPAKPPSYKATPVPAFAEGGVTPGGTVMVGERGPERVNLPQGSFVYTAQQTRSIAAAQINVPGAIEAVQDQNAIFGGSTQTGSPTFSLDSTAGSQYERWDDMIGSIDRLGNKIDKYEREKVVYMSNKQFDEKRSDIARIKNIRNMQ